MTIDIDPIVDDGNKTMDECDASKSPYVVLVIGDDKNISGQIIKNILDRHRQERQIVTIGDPYIFSDMNELQIVNNDYLYPSLYLQRPKPIEYGPRCNRQKGKNKRYF